MKLRANALHAAVAAHLSAALADKIGGKEATDELSLDDAAKRLAVALIERPEAEDLAEALTLASVTLTGVGETITLDADDALAHPLLTRWLGASLIAMLAQVLKAGAQNTQLAPGAPFFGDVEVCDDGFLYATSELHFTDQSARAVALYGVRTPSAAYTTSKRLCGSALINAGAAARAGDALADSAKSSLLDLIFRAPVSPDSTNPMGFALPETRH